MEKVQKETYKNFSLLCKENADYIFSQDSESIAWLFNMRGADLPNTPLVFCSALIGKNNQKIFLKINKFQRKSKIFA